MKKEKISHSEVSITSQKSNIQYKEVNIPPYDVLFIKVLSLRIPDDKPRHYTIKITFFDHLIVTALIKSTEARDVLSESVTLASGNMDYDPSDFKKMCLFANSPLIVNIQHNKNLDIDVGQTGDISNSNNANLIVETISDISCCNIDILPIFLDQDKLYIRKRLEPIREPSVLFRKSWDNLPLISLELYAVRNPLNAHHHKIFKEANYMKLTLIASFNMIMPFDDEFIYTAASKMPLQNEKNTGLVTFSEGYRIPKRFNALDFYPKWESLRSNNNIFTKGDERFICNVEEIQNDHRIPINSYIHITSNYTTVWGSFHRTLMLEETNEWLLKHLRCYHWPLEIHMNRKQGGHSFMAFLNLFNLLYPGETKLRLAVPLQWVNDQAMMDNCGCELLFTPIDNGPSTANTPQSNKNAVEFTRENTIGDTDASIIMRPTGADENSAFVIVEVKLGKPLKKAFIPPCITNSEIEEMLKQMESVSDTRECKGRGQLNRDWHSTVRSALSSLRKVPQYGVTEFCNFDRQLSATRTRVELMTSIWQDAAIYVNNNFVIQDFLHSEEVYEEMLMMAHACLMKTTYEILMTVDSTKHDPVLRAARHARHMQDVTHATELYLQLVVQRPNDADCWRELGTCLLDVDCDWANVCINKSLELNPRHPLTLLSKGCIVFEENPEEAEVFFIAILSLYPLWITGWVVANVYYYQQEHFNMAEKIIFYAKKTSELKELIQDFDHPRSWENELGDWWDHTLLLPEMSLYYNAADLLLRLRGLSLAELCVARALSEAGETAAYFHLVALCCRLRGNVNEALCHIHHGVQKFGEISYLRSLEAECLHKKNYANGVMACFEQSAKCIGSYSILLSLPSFEPQSSRSILMDLIRREPSAYAWMALADNWMKQVEVDYADIADEQVLAKMFAEACAIQALKLDKRAGRAWALLAKLVTPNARRLHCRNMAIICGYHWTNDQSSLEPRQSWCHRLTTSLTECRCKLCAHLKLQ